MNKSEEIIKAIETKKQMVGFINEAINEIIADFQVECKNKNLSYTIENYTHLAQTTFSCEYAININGVNILFNRKDVKNKVSLNSVNKEFIKNTINEIIIDQLNK